MVPSKLVQTGASRPPTHLPPAHEIRHALVMTGQPDPPALQELALLRGEVTRLEAELAAERAKRPSKEMHDHGQTMSRWAWLGKINLGY